MKTSQIFPKKKKFTDLLQVSDNNGGIILVKGISGGQFGTWEGYHFYHYDSDLKLVGSDNVKAAGKRYNKISYVEVTGNGEVRVFENVWNDDLTGSTYYVISSKLEDFNFERIPLEANSTGLPSKKSKVFFYGARGINLDDVSSYGEPSISPKKKFLAFNYSMNYGDARARRYITYNEFLEKVYDITSEKDVSNGNWEVEDTYTSDIDGEVFYLERVFRTKKKKHYIKEKSNYLFEVTKVSEAGAISNTFSSERYVLSELKIYEYDGVLNCVGLYANSSTNKYLGIVSFQFNKSNLEIIEENYAPFLDRFTDEKYEQRKEKHLKNPELKGFKLFDGGNIKLVYEENFKKSWTKYGSGLNGSSWKLKGKYFFGDIMILTLDRNGNIIQNINIKKDQEIETPYGVTNLGASIKPYFIEDQVKILLLSEKKLDEDKFGNVVFTRGKHKDAIPYQIVINEDGSYSYQKVPVEGNSENYFLVEDAVGDDESGKVIFKSFSKKGKKYYKID